MDPAPDLSKPWAFVILEDSIDPVRGYIPCVVVEGDPAIYAATGANGSSPWYWGTDRDRAREIAQQKNARRGISPEEAERIRDSSIAASLRKSAG